MKNDNENYLLGEMEAEQRNEFEDRIFADDDRFFELCETENALIDRYAADDLSGADKARFEDAIKDNAGLASKVANARTLRNFVRSEQREEANKKTQPMGFWDGLRALFSFSPVPSFALGGVFLILAAACAFLVVENGRRNAEIARLEAELSNSNPPARENDLERELTDARARESQLNGQVDEERDISGDLASDLAREREYRRRLERDIAALKKPGEPETASPGGETVSVLKLDANTSTGEDVPQLNAEGGPERVSLSISLPPTVPPDGRVSIRLNGREIARNVMIRQNGSAGLRVFTAFNARQLAAGQNVVTVHDPSGKEIASYKIQGGQVK